MTISNFAAFSKIPNKAYFMTIICWNIIPCFFPKLGKILQNLSSAANVIDGQMRLTQAFSTNKARITTHVWLCHLPKCFKGLLFKQCRSSLIGSTLFPSVFKLSQCIRFPTMWYMWPAKAQTSLRIRAVWSEPLLVTRIFYECWATDQTYFGVTRLKKRLPRLVWVNTCQNATLLEISCHGSNIFGALFIFLPLIFR